MTKFIPGKTRIEYGGAIIGQEEKDAINSVINSQGGRRWTIGPESEAFERELAQKTSVRRAVVTNSGSSALLLALTSLHLPEGSGVIIPAVTFPTAYNVILQNNLLPIVVDVDIDSFNLKLTDVWKALNLYRNIETIIAVNIAGNPVDMKRLREVAGNCTKIILDNCDGYGTTLNGEFIDTYADISCVSFHAAHIITTGEGGAVLTNNDEYADRARKLREWGRAGGTDKLYSYPGFPDDYRERYVFEEIGYNLKPLELQCAMGRVQLKKLEAFKRKRARNFKELSKVFFKYPQFKTLNYLLDSDPCWMYFPLFIEGLPRKYVMDNLERNNIETRTVFSGNILKHPAYAGIKSYTAGPLDNANEIMKKGMFLSVHPTMTMDMIRYIDKTIREICLTYSTE